MGNSERKITVIGKIREDAVLKSLFFVLIKTNAYLSYCESPRTTTWGVFSNNIKSLLDNGDLGAAKDNMSAIIAAMFDELSKRLEVKNYKKDFDFATTDGIFRTFMSLMESSLPPEFVSRIKTEYNLSFSDSEVNARHELEQSQVRKLLIFHKAIYQYFQIENTVLKLFKSKKNLLPQLGNGSVDQFYTIQLSCQQEIYHSFSHLTIDCHSSFDTKVERATSHINRASLDLAKVGVNILRFLKDSNEPCNPCGLNERIIEIEHVGKNDKREVLDAYILVLRQGC